ncbi:The BTB (BR-C, ttk and bab)/POZ (Pox virus and Zinc finger) domain [Ceratobasidium sp. AG-Ba]|nr:The BTB (BR-C, ttk and bab)/POZ (Pox virus and Zinc finger) domain [Ceratobasidium sp. AG-Ba]
MPATYSVSCHETDLSLSAKCHNGHSPLVARLGASFHFEVPTGGDISLTSCDGLEFAVHSEILGRFSSTFADMLSAGTKSEDTIVLGDDAESVSLMLAAIYCPDALCILDLDPLEKLLRMSQKYDIPCVVCTFDATIPQGLHGDFLKNDPFRLFRICTSYGLENTATLAVKSIQDQLGYFQNQKAVARLASLSGGSIILSLAGMGALRAKILHDVLYDFQSGLPPPDSDEEPDPEMLSNLLCTTCYKTLKNSIRYPDLTFRPHWLFDWARLSFNELISKDLDECSDLFQAGVFARVVKIADHPYCAQEVRSHELIFNNWAGNVREKLRKELTQLDIIHQL